MRSSAQLAHLTAQLAHLTAQLAHLTAQLAHLTAQKKKHRTMDFRTHKASVLLCISVLCCGTGAIGIITGQQAAYLKVRMAEVKTKIDGVKSRVGNVRESVISLVQNRLPTVATFSAGSCPDPPVITGASIFGCSTPYEESEVCIYTCSRGYVQEGGTRSRACRGESWEGSDLVCTEQTLGSCPDPRNITGASITGCSAPYEESEVCIYSCDRGYVQEGGNWTRACRGGSWEGSDLICTEQTLGPCPDPPTISGARTFGCDAPYEENEICTYFYSCESGNLQDGVLLSRTCQGGSWEQSDSNCTQEYCFWEGTASFCDPDADCDWEGHVQGGSCGDGQCCFSDVEVYNCNGK
ncbi:complement receptor type 2-like isoform X2 [Branchiostoma floridae x Branchiostoma belcheri]